MPTNETAGLSGLLQRFNREGRLMFACSGLAYKITYAGCWRGVTKRRVSQSVCIANVSVWNRLCSVVIWNLACQ